MTLLQSIETTSFNDTLVKPLFLDVSNTQLHVTDEQFEQLAQANPDLRLELTSAGELIVMSPAFPITGERNADLTGQIWSWNRQKKLGRLFDSSTGYNSQEFI